MNDDRGLNRLLDAWFAEGPVQVADRVIDDTASRIARQRQTPAWRLHSWRFPTMSTPIKLVAIGATLLAVLVGGAVIMGGGSAPPAPTPTPVALGGTVHHQIDGTPATTEVDAIATGASVSGTAVTTFRGQTHTVRLACTARYGDTWVLAGTTEQSTVPGEPLGTWSAVFVKEGSPQQIGIWLSGDAPAGSDCDGFLAAHNLADIGPENFQTVESGSLMPPPDLAR